MKRICLLILFGAFVCDMAVADEPASENYRNVGGAITSFGGRVESTNWLMSDTAGGQSSPTAAGVADTQSSNYRNGPGHIPALQIRRDLDNESFESDLDGWTTSGDVESIANQGTLPPEQGSGMLILRTTLDTASSKQTFTYPFRSSLLFRYNFLTNEAPDDATNNDTFSVRTSTSVGYTTVLSEDTFSDLVDGTGTGYTWQTGWKTGMALVAPFAGGPVPPGAPGPTQSQMAEPVMIEFKIEDAGTSSSASAVVVDDVQIFPADMVLSPDCPKINFSDLSAFSSSWGCSWGEACWGPPSNSVKADLNNDGVVNFSDLSVFSANWGNEYYCEP